MTNWHDNCCINSVIISFLKYERRLVMTLTLVEKCISCNQELAPWERNRADCLVCRERAIEVYGDDIQDFEDKL